jgi:hypothetical protein
LFLVKTGQTHRGPQFQRLRLLFPGEGEGPAKTGFRLVAGDCGRLLPQQRLALEAMQLCPVKAFARAVHQGQGFGQHAQALLDLSFPAQGFGPAPNGKDRFRRQAAEG